MRQLINCKMRQKFITKCVRVFITKCNSFITKCNSYCKIRRLFKLRQYTVYSLWPSVFLKTMIKCTIKLFATNCRTTCSYWRSSFFRSIYVEQLINELKRKKTLEKEKWIKKKKKNGFITFVVVTQQYSTDWRIML